MYDKKWITMKYALVMLLFLGMMVVDLPIMQMETKAEDAISHENEYVSNEIIIKFKDPLALPGQEKQLKREIGRIHDAEFIEDLGIYVIKAEDLCRDPVTVLNHFKNNKFIEYAELNYIAQFAYTPNDPLYRTYQSSVANIINAPAGWDITTGTGSPVIAVIDSGIAIHPDLPTLFIGYSVVSNLSPNYDSRDHGTNVAGVLGAVGNNGIGVAGLNWHAKILPVKVDNASGSTSATNVASGITWAANNGAKVINISLAFTADSITLKNAIDNAYSKGCAIFAASGNESRNTIPYPARYSNVMAVGSSGDGKTRIASSNYGEGMGVVAFASYYSISSAGGYVGVGGTSISTPQVSGLASLIWAVNPDLTNSQVYRLIEQGAKPLGGGYNLETGYGLIDCGKTLAMALETVGPPQYTTPPVITLNGLIEVTLEEGNAYIEPGCTAQDCLGVDITAQVNVSGSVNTSVPGAYTITYEVTDAGGNTTRVTRTVTVVAVVPQYNTPPVITLKGMENITIEEGNTYIEPGYTATDCLGVDITVQVIVSGSVNTSVPGNYTITYKVTDAGDNTTSVTRTVTVTEIIPVLSPPALNLIGANPIILHLGGSAYIEQGALAYDDADGNISGLVQITGGPDTNHSGTYTVTYRVVNSAGLEAVATRQVRVLAPIVTTLPRTSYNFTGQGKVPTTVTHNGIVAEAAGFMDLNITNLSGKMSITVKLVNIDTGAIAFSNTYSTEGVRQFFVDPGRYNLVVTIDSGNGNCNYKLTLLMPEVVIWTFELPETPQGGSYTAYAGPIYQAA